MQFHRVDEIVEMDELRPREVKSFGSDDRGKD